MGAQYGHKLTRGRGSIINVFLQTSFMDDPSLNEQNARKYSVKRLVLFFLLWCG